jgi:hypothetical protein
MLWFDGCPLIVGAVADVVTVRIAAALVAVPTVLLTTTVNLVPFADIVSVGVL